MLVIDCSVLIKVILPENFSEIADQLLEPSHDLHAPDLLMPELGNVLWKKTRQGLLAAPDAEAILRHLEMLRLQVHSSMPLLPEAFGLATRFDRTVYDCLYVALAIEIGATFVTADRRFYDALADAYPETMLWIEDLSRISGA